MAVSGTGLSLALELEARGLARLPDLPQWLAAESPTLAVPPTPILVLMAEAALRDASSEVLRCDG